MIRMSVGFGRVDDDLDLQTWAFVDHVVNGGHKRFVHHNGGRFAAQKAVPEVARFQQRRSRDEYDSTPKIGRVRRESANSAPVQILRLIFFSGPKAVREVQP